MDVAVFGWTVRQVAQRIREERLSLAEEWLDRVRELAALQRLDVFPLHRLLDYIPELLDDVAAHLESADGAVLEREGSPGPAAALGVLRHAQHASVDQILREYGALSEVLAAFLEQEIASMPDVDAEGALAAMRRLDEGVRALQQHTVNSFVAQYTRTLERQTAQLRKFSRLVSHEIRQPLAVLQVVARALPAAAASADGARMMDIFDRSIARLTDVTGKLERLSRIDHSADFLPTERPLSLTDVADEAAAQLAEAASGHGVEVRVARDLPVLRMDPSRAELIFVNLMANAIKYSDPSKSVRYVEIERASGNQPSVLVRDNGCGMAPNRLQTIFREFVRAHSQRDDDIRGWGLGLGLAIVRECMDHSNGSVRVDSLEGRGTTFKLTWPRAMSAR